MSTNSKLTEKILSKYENMTREEIIERCEMYRRQLGGLTASRYRPVKRRNQKKFDDEEFVFPIIEKVKNSIEYSTISDQTEPIVVFTKTGFELLLNLVNTEFKNYYNEMK